MSRPDTLPSWTDDDDPSKVVEPSGVKKLQGWTYKERPAFQFWNWVQRNFVKWFLHIDVSVNQFDCHASATPDEFLNVTAGKVRSEDIVISKALQQIDFTGFYPTAAAASRIDVIVIDNITGVVSRIAGIQAASPTVPSISINRTALCEVLVDGATSSITNDMITDIRQPISSVVLIDEDSFASDSDKSAPTQQSVKAYTNSVIFKKDYSTGTFTDINLVLPEGTYLVGRVSGSDVLIRELISAVWTTRITITAGSDYEFIISDGANIKVEQSSGTSRMTTLHTV